MCLHGKIIFLHFFTFDSKMYNRLEMNFSINFLLHRNCYIFIQSSYFLWLMCYTVVSWLASRIKWGQHLDVREERIVMSCTYVQCVVLSWIKNEIFMYASEKKLWPSSEAKNIINCDEKWVVGCLLVISTYNGHFMPSFSRYKHIIIGF